MPIIKRSLTQPDDPIFEEAYSLSPVRKPMSALEYTKVKLELLEKGLGLDDPVVKQLRIQLAILEESGNTESAFQKLDDD